ncbi:hypothetical protein [Butyrivibrio proteoclasticus]|uniref:hypothetical protein n=1 Tax=Butyrivibrio proteoclasticus TaxID=43305 RepID=UPI0011606CD4|nr:hypothetical protein [Butyrivibrio proteoclasticus]
MATNKEYGEIMVRQRAVFMYATLFLFLVFLYGYVGYSSYGYDDEFYTIADVESYPTFAQQLAINNSVDIHPPGSYLICLFLWKITSDWHLVRMISGIVNAVFIFLFWKLCIVNRLDNTNGILVNTIFSFLVTCLNPAILMWGTSIRWFTYVFPCVCVLGLLMNHSKINKWLFWEMVYVVYAWIFYLENTTAIIIAISFMVLLFQRKEQIKEEILPIVLFGLATLFIMAHQFYIFFTVRVNNYGYDRAKGGILKGVIYGAENMLCGQGVMPVSIWGIFLIFANLILFISFVLNIKKIVSNEYNQFFLGTYIIYMVSGLGALRNYTGIFPLQGFFVSVVFANMHKKVVKNIVLVLTVLGTVGGLYNVITHTDTTKNQWNMPFAEVIDYIHDNTEDVDSTLVISKDAVIIYYLRNEGYNVILLEGYQQFEQQQLNPNWKDIWENWDGDVFALTTFEPTGRNNKEYAEYLETLEGYKQQAEHVEFGYDRYAWFKRFLDPGLSDTYLDLYRINSGSSDDE